MKVISYINNVPIDKIPKEEAKRLLEKAIDKAMLSRGWIPVDKNTYIENTTKEI